jgi:transposase
MAGALALVDVLGRQMAEMDQQLQELRGPMAPQLAQLDSMPGVHASTARDIIAASGLDRTRCGSASRLAAWASVSPGHNDRAGKRRQGRSRQGNRYLRRVLVQGRGRRARPQRFGVGRVVAGGAMGKQAGRAGRQGAGAGWHFATVIKPAAET